MLVAVSVLALWWGLPAPAAAQCGVFKTWALNEILTSTDLNSAFTRTVTSNIASCVTGDSSSVSQMRVTVDPFPGTSASQASTVQGELERLRFQLKAIVGKSYWYEVIDNSLARDVSKHWGATYTSYTEIADPPPPPALNTLSLYAKDDGAGNTVLAYRDHAGIVNTLTGPSSSYGSAVTIKFIALNNPGTPNTKINLSADRISVAGFIKSPFTTTVDATTTGADALDSGTLAANTFYYLYVILRPPSNTFSGLLSTSGTNPTMPIGYTKRRLVGGFGTDATAHFLKGVQFDSSFSFATPPQVITSSVLTNATALDLSAYVPTVAVSAVEINVLVAGGATAGFHWQSWSGVPTVTKVAAFYQEQSGQSGAPMRVPTRGDPRSTIFYAVSPTYSIDAVALSGWDIQWPD
jgi:hypothetical protein